jgi:hypothetical protein
MTGINFEYEVNRLRFYKGINPRKGITNFWFDHGLINFFQLFESWENFRVLLMAAGYERCYTYRAIKRLKKQYDIAKSIQN